MQEQARGAATAPGIVPAGGAADPLGKLFETFHSRFEVVAADTPELVDAARALRYQVYCLEHGFEDPLKHPDGLERDPYDFRSAHALVRHRQSGRFVGAVRLVLPDPLDPGAPFPIEAHCRSAFFRPSIRRDLPRPQVAEISRFAVSREFRQQLAEDGPASGSSPQPMNMARPRAPGSPQRHLPHITIGLFAGIVRMSVDHRISHWYAVMEPALLRLLTRFGIHFQAIGQTVSYHGQRRPSLGVAEAVLARIQRERREVWEVITDRGRTLPLSGQCPRSDDGS